MALLPDKKRMIFTEQNVNIPAGTRADAAYDLGLYREQGSEDRGVLVVTVILSFKFKDGKGSSDPKVTLAWTPEGKADYMKRFREACVAVWSEKYRITTTCDIPSVKDVGVTFDIQTSENMSVLSHSHWNLTVTAIDKAWDQNWTRGCGGWISNGELQLNSSSVNAVNKGAAPDLQRPAVHEFGHMMGYRDEYPSAPKNATMWNADKTSVMNESEGLRPRHYVFFADWISRQYNAMYPKGCKVDDWKVNGTIDLTSAQI